MHSNSSSFSMIFEERRAQFRPECALHLQRDFWFIRRNSVIKHQPVTCPGPAHQLIPIRAVAGIWVRIPVFFPVSRPRAHACPFGCQCVNRAPIPNVHTRNLHLSRISRPAPRHRVLRMTRSSPLDRARASREPRGLARGYPAICIESRRTGRRWQRVWF
jgi:hypothetical protein